MIVREKSLLRLFACAVLLLISQIASAQGNGLRMPTIFDRLTQEEAAKLTLEMDYTTLLENRKTNQYFPATLTDANGKTYQVEVKPRGKYRRKVCEEPPLKVKFSKKGLRAEGLDTLNEVKIVMPCYDNPRGDELIIREYVAYRMFEHMTAASVKARLIRLTLKDTHVESKRNMYCLLIEDEEETVARLGGTLVEQYGIPPDSLIMNQAALVCMFQYMIGNTDWDVSMMRNIRLIRSAETGKVLVVPYDFDFSGLVSAPYSSPSSDTGLRTVRDRFLMANGIPQESLKRATQMLRSARKDFLGLCKN
ncbi:MAG: hypothetical protein IT259_16490 [Saprospiraceae bacterium]|nr:hypothetical protein [Saprospiraceae bacterium]